MSGSEFVNDTKNLGFTLTKTTDGSSYKLEIPYNDKVRIITFHTHNIQARQIKADTLRYVVNNLKEIGWFNDLDNVKKFPFQKWGFNNDGKELLNKALQINKENEEIVAANEEYKNAEIIPFIK